MSNRDSRHDGRKTTRRQFLRQSACAGVGSVALVNSIAQLRLVSAAVAGAAVDDYKALVCVFLQGGNDSNNTIVPAGGNLRADYETGRGVLALPVDQLRTITPLNESRPFGLHPNLPDLANLFNSGRMAVVSNVGVLSYPVPDREAVLNETVPLPPSLFSHSDQQTQWQSSVPDQPFQSGWGGRAVDLLHASYNAGSNVSMSISLDGINNLQIGTSGVSTQYTMSRNGVPSLAGFGTNYSGALNADGSYKNNNQGRRLRGLLEVMQASSEHLMESSYSGVMIDAWETEQFIRAALEQAAAAESAGGFSFDGLFSAATSKLGDQLAQVARLIAGREALGNNRQIFFCRINGYDTHQDQLGSHAELMTELNASLSAFDAAMVQLGIDDRVTTFTVSDFNRTFTPNGTDGEAGSDHAWGGHAMVMGGAVQGGRMYGAFPELELGAVQDVSTRGRWLPTTSVDQYGAVLAKWLGADDTALEAIFPNLGRFDDPFGGTANLDFLNLG